MMEISLYSFLKLADNANIHHTKKPMKTPTYY